MANEGSPSVPQQPVERMTVQVCDKHPLTASVLDPGEEAYCPDCSLYDSWPGEEARQLHEAEFVPALVAERLAEAAQDAVSAITEPYAGDGPAAAARLLRAALEAYESGGATKPGEET